MDRGNLIDSVLLALGRLKKKHWRYAWRVVFAGEEGVDAGGLLKVSSVGCVADFDGVPALPVKVQGVFCAVVL